MNSNHALVVLLLLPSASLGQFSHGYKQSEQGRYIDGFEAMIEGSYSEPLPEVVKAECAARGTASGREVLLRNNGVVDSVEAQKVCSPSDTCVVPVGTTLRMTSNLNVGSLVVQGEFVWDETTQAGQTTQHLCAGYVAAEEGSRIHVSVGSSGTRKAVVFIKDNGMGHRYLGHRAFGGVKGTVEVFGRPVSRTWTLLASPGRQGDNTLALLHSPQEMGWRVGDRVVVAPTKPRSQGTAEQLRVTEILPDGMSVRISPPLTQDFLAEFVPAEATGSVLTVSAEVINLSRDVLITGDDFRHVPCSGQSGATQCTDGLHTIQMFGGVSRIHHTRVEKCGQRGRMGKYCLHFHVMGECAPGDCSFVGNAVEFGQQRGVVVHSTHRSLVQGNVFNDIRGVSLYVAEDGNEMENQILHNVAVCPWSHYDPVKRGCSIPGTDNDQADTVLNIAGMWALSKTNVVVGNRIANHFNGMMIDGAMFQGDGRGVSEGRICSKYTPMGLMEGNTFHSHGRFGTYFLNTWPKKDDGASTPGSNGMPRSPEALEASCRSFDPEDGRDRGAPAAIGNNLDYGNVFVGQYGVGDVQYLRHASLDSYNPMYWKTTKNFADGCSAHMEGGVYEGGHVRLPDYGAFVMEGTEFRKDTKMVAVHHCGVGTTGLLCNPTYVFSNVAWKVETPPGLPVFFFDRDNMNNRNYGGMFVLSPPEEGNPEGKVFPGGFCSLAHRRWSYLLSLDGGESCVLRDDRAEYNGGILCRRPLRRFNLLVPPNGAGAAAVDGAAPDLLVEVVQGGAVVAEFAVPLWTGGAKRGYGFVAVPLGREGQGWAPHEYRLRLSSGTPVPPEWIVEFSDPIFGNRWGAVDRVRVSISGRDCGSEVTSQHDRTFIWSGDSVHGPGSEAWGRGACAGRPDIPPAVCRRGPAASLLPPLCSGCSDGYDPSLCAPCEASGGLCTARYLGGSLAPAVHACLFERPIPLPPPPTPLAHPSCDAVSACSSGQCSTCGERVRWLISQGSPEHDARRVVGTEFPHVCVECPPQVGSQPTAVPRTPVPATPHPTPNPTPNPTPAPEAAPKHALVACDEEAACAWGACHSCGSRVSWLIHETHISEEQARTVVGGEFPTECCVCPQSVVRTKAPATQPPATHAPPTPAPDTPAPPTLSPDTPAPPTLSPDTPAPRTTAPNTLAPLATPLALPACDKRLACAWGACYSCGSRVQWLKVAQGKTEEEARRVVGIEFPAVCGGC